MGTTRKYRRVGLAFTQRQRHLAVVRGEGLLRPSEVIRLPSLEAQPTRPGEVARTLILDLALETRAFLGRRAAASAVPCEVWVRLAVEARRVRRELGHAFALGEEKVEQLLDAAANERLNTQRSAPFRPNPLSVYAEKLTSGVAMLGQTVSSRISVAVSEREYASWERGASEAHVSLGAFVAEGIASAPASAVRWEAEAALAGRTLAEWGYRAITTGGDIASD